MDAQTHREDRRAALLAKAQAELEGLESRGVVMAGNAFSSVLLVKGEPGEEERGGARLLSGEDGNALRAALRALGYAPEDWVALATWDASGGRLTPELFRETLCTLDPATVILCDEAAADLMRESYAEDLSVLDSFEEAMLTPGVSAQVLGLRTLNLGGFAAALSDKQQKAIMWQRLKKLPPLGEPY